MINHHIFDKVFSELMKYFGMNLIICVRTDGQGFINKMYHISPTTILTLPLVFILFAFFHFLFVVF